MTDEQKKGNLFDRLKYLFWGLAILWTGIIVTSLVWNFHEQKEKIFEIALNSAHLTFEKDVIYRRWTAKQGGVYVPVSKHTPPNPYLKVRERDIFTSSGSLLTLVNPAYMTRQVNEMAANIPSSRSHITSLNPIRPQNSPDPWETSALKSFEKGCKEVSSVGKVAGEEYMRFMRPFVTEKTCLKCHASQGYKEGDIRGGISVSIPMAPLWAIERPYITKISLAHLFLWIAGIFGIVISKKSLAKQIIAREMAETVLSQSENKLRIVADFTYDWEYWRKPDGSFVYISPSCERITGYTREEFMQNPDLYLRIIHPDDRQRMLEHFHEDLSHCQLCEMEFRILHRDGRERWIGHACRSVLDAQGQMLGRRASDRDITERKGAEEELRRNREWLGITLSSIGDAVVATDASGRVTFLNPVAEILTGWQEEEALGQPVQSVFRIINEQNGQPSENIVRKVLEEGCSINLANHTALITRDRSEIPIEDSAAPIKDTAGNIIGVVLVFHDVTEKRRTQQALRKSRDELEIRVQERTGELTAEIEQRKRTEDALQESKEQLRILASQILSAQENERKRIALEVHDVLGSSLSAIKFKAEEALHHLPKDGASNISKPLEALIPLVQDTISEARRIQADLRPPLLDDLGIVATLSWFCRRFETIYTNIAVEPIVTLREEEVPDQLKIVLFRFTQEAMNNIGKHAQADSVHLGLRKVDGAIELRISDNGAGFDPEALSSREISKKGLGLSSMKERVEFSGGSFSIDSVKGKGTVIRALWPF